MKLNSKIQMIIAIAIVVVFYALAVIFNQYYSLFRMLGLCLSGLLYAIHPVVPENAKDNKQIKTAVRVAGIFLILIGLFT